MVQSSTPAGAAGTGAKLRKQPLAGRADLREESRANMSEGALSNPSGSGFESAVEDPSPSTSSIEVLSAPAHSTEEPDVLLVAAACLNGKRSPDLSPITVPRKASELSHSSRRTIKVTSESGDACPSPFCADVAGMVIGGCETVTSGAATKHYLSSGAASTMSRLSTVTTDSVMAAGRIPEEKAEDGEAAGEREVTDKITLIRAHSLPKQWNFSFSLQNPFPFPIKGPSSENPAIHEVSEAADIPTSARDFSDLTDPRTIKRICHSLIPGWNLVEDDANIRVSQIMAGLTNQLFKVELHEGAGLTKEMIALQPHARALFRIYGANVSDLYDPAVELKQYKLLSKVGVAPKLIGQFEGGRIEEWILGPSLLVKDMVNPSVVCAIASILGRFHALGKACPEINENYVEGQEAFCWTYIRKWRAKALAVLGAAREVASEANGRSETCNLSQISDGSSRTDQASSQFERQRRKLLNFRPDRMMAFLESLEKLNLEKFSLETASLKSYCLEGPRVQHSQAIEIVFCHNDVQENNILVTNNCLRLIDYEYANFNHPAFDIANFFWESTCDYTHPEYPFFSIGRNGEEFPSEELIRLFAAVYLSEYGANVCLPSNDAVMKPFVEAVFRFVLVSDALWAFWSVIRACQASTSTEFDYVAYAAARIKHYQDWKHVLIQRGILGGSSDWE